MTRRCLAFALLLVLLAPVVEAGAVLADDLRDLEVAAMAGQPAPAGTLVGATSVPFDHDVPEMPNLLAIDSPVEEPALSAPRQASVPVVETPVAAPRVVRTRGHLDRGPPAA